MLDLFLIEKSLVFGFLLWKLFKCLFSLCFCLSF